VRGLAGSPALLLGLDAVRDGVLHQMQERVGDPLDHRAVCLHPLAPRLEHHRPAGRARGFPHLAGQAREEPAHGDHAGPRDRRAQVARQALHAGHLLPRVAYQAAQPGLDLRHVAADLRHRSGQDAGLVVPVELQLPEHRRLRPAGGPEVATRPPARDVLGQAGQA
jgi:hypothetical protein